MSTAYYGSAPVPPRPNWFSRNWKWFIPMGCLVCLLALGGFIAAIVSIVAGAMKSSDAYKQAMAKVSSNPAAIEALGTPIESGFLISGNVNVNNDSGAADIYVPVHGPKGKGKIHVVGAKESGVWHYSRMMLTLDDGKTVDLAEE